MGASLGSGGRDGRRYRRRQFGDINITPMVDVMLVLLDIFMITAPMLTAGVNLDLPQAPSKPLAGQDEPISVSIRGNGDIYIQKTPVSIENLGTKLRAIAGEKTDTRIFVRGDRSLNYGRIMQVIGTIAASGYPKVALVTVEAPVPTRKER